MLQERNSDLLVVIRNKEEKEWKPKSCLTLLQIITVGFLDQMLIVCVVQPKGAKEHYDEST